MINHSDFFPHSRPVSQLGFGTPGLVGMDSDATRERLFAQLVDGGVRHFDTAPYYGYGAAETMLGKLMSGRRHDLTVTTKFGIQPPRLLTKGIVNRLARRVLKLAPGLRSALSRGAQAATSRGAFGVDDARRSLENSLRSLKTDYVDLFLLHEPSADAALQADLLGFFEDSVRAGKIRAYGCGGNFGGVQAIRAKSPDAFRFLQFEDSVVEPNLDALSSDVRAITYRSIATVPKLLEEVLRADPGKAREFDEQVGMDCTNSSVLGKLLLHAALHRNRAGAVLFSSTRTSHVALALQAAETSDTAFTDAATRLWQLARREVAHATAPEQ